tara:strand:- start:88808 stop:88951 length:144 start_codon:yes stop_codon:yes gene_type:complete
MMAKIKDLGDFQKESIKLMKELQLPQELIKEFEKPLPDFLKNLKRIS